MKQEERSAVFEEKRAPAANGMLILLIFGALYLAALAGLLYFYAMQPAPDSLGRIAENPIPAFLEPLTLGWVIIGWFPFLGLKVLRPNEAFVLTLFGNYHGTLRGPGFFWVNPFSGSINPGSSTQVTLSSGSEGSKHSTSSKTTRHISMKSMTLSNDKQKINDKLGNPIVIGIVVIWRVVNTARAAFNVDNYHEFLSIQCDSALRNIVRLYPYDCTDEEGQGEKSLRGSSMEIAQHLRDEIQEKVEIAGLEICEARITSLAYAPEIAAAMLQRQQAKAIIDARQMIVDGAVGMVESALAKLSENNVVELDEERKAAMVSNLLVVLCANKEAQPIVNSGSLY